MRSFLLLPLAACLLLSGCAGYHVGPIKPKPLRGITSLAVPSFKNDTLEPRVEVLLADSVIKQLQQDGTYRIASEHDADAILECNLQEIIRRPSRSVRGNVLQTREYVLYLRIGYRVLDRGGKSLATGVVVGQSSFFVTGSETLASDVNQDERQAFPLAAEDAAVHLVTQLSEGW